MDRASEHRCERCGAPARQIDTASHLFCDACAALASTGARVSSELLFQLPPPPERKSVEDLATLARAVPSAHRDRASIEPLLAIAPPVPTLAPPKSSTRLRAIIPFAALGASAVLFAAAAALAIHASAIEPTVVQVVGVPAAEDAPRAPAASAPPQAPLTPPTEIVPAEPLPPVSDAADAHEETRAPSAVTPRRRPSRPAPVALDLAPRPAPAPPAPRAVIPSRVEVAQAMRALEPTIAQCSDTAQGTVATRVTFLGRTGHAVHAEVQGDSVPPAVRSCIARALRGAEVSAFAQERFTVAFPYRI
jgi:hypothetical protein